MAKGARSNSKKKLGSWKRNHLVPGWQEKADAARAAKLAECMAAPSVAPFVNTRELEENAQMEERGREGRKQKKPAAAQQQQVDSDQEMEEDVPMTKKGRKGEKGLHGRVQKKRRAGKLFMVGQKNQFHPKKKTTKTPINGRKRG